MAKEQNGPGLRQHFNNKVCRGDNIYQRLCVTSTGTGLGSKSYRIGQCVLDSSSGNWFLCTATAGSGTWVKINA